MKDQLLDDHVDDLRLPYLEGLLSPEEKASFEDHLDQCPACKSKLEEMSRWASVLGENAHEMCPDAWELFDYVRSGKDLRGTISSHVETCHLCSTDVESFRKEISAEAVPEALWKKMQNLSQARVADRPRDYCIAVAFGKTGQPDGPVSTDDAGSCGRGCHDLACRILVSDRTCSHGGGAQFRQVGT